MKPRQRTRPDVALALELGWIPAGHSGGGHLRFKHPLTGGLLFMSNTPSDGRRAHKNSCSVVRRVTQRENERASQQ